MFTHVVMLKCAPYFLYAENEKDALAICDKFKDDLVGIVIGENLFVKQPQVKFSFDQAVTHQIAYTDKVEKIEQAVTDEEEQTDMLGLSDEMEAEFEKLQSSIG